MVHPRGLRAWHVERLHDERGISPPLCRDGSMAGANVKSEPDQMAMGKSDGQSTRSAGKPRTWGRVSGKINFKGETSMGATKPNTVTATKLMRIAQLSRENPASEFSWLMPHYNRESLMGCFNELDRKKAVGADGVSKVVYGVNAAANIDALIEKMKTMSYQIGRASCRERVYVLV